MTLSDWFAHDSFRNGGAPIRYGTVPIPDKLAHFLAGAVLWLLGAHVLNPLRRLELILWLAVMWEIVELVRWIRWQHRKTVDAVLEWTGPWPKVADRFSWRDVVATMAGALTAFALTWR